MKGEPLNSPNDLRHHRSIIVRSSLSSCVYDAERQRQILEQDGVVEQHRVDFDKPTGKNTCFEQKRLEEGKLP